MLDRIKRVVKEKGMEWNGMKNWAEMPWSRGGHLYGTGDAMDSDFCHLNLCDIGSVLTKKMPEAACGGSRESLVNASLYMPCKRESPLLF